MKDIKTRNVAEKTIKTLDKSLIVADKTKDTLVITKEKVNNLNNKDSEIQYASNKISRGTDKTIRTSAKVAKREIKKAPERIRKTAKNTAKATKKGIKTAKKVAETSAKVAKKTAQATKHAVKVTAKAVKVAVKATIAAIKAMVAAVKALVAAIAAGGWVAVVVIVLICLIGLLCASIFGVFFSNETGSKPMTDVIRETNSQVYKEIENITDYDELEIESTYTNWNEIIAVYSVEYSENGKYNISVIDERNEKYIKEMFWKFNSIKYSAEKVTTEDGKYKTILKIKITSKSKEEVMKDLGFSQTEVASVKELLSDEYDSLWKNLIYGSLNGNKQIVEIAKQQVGNVGGEPYWRWYGFDHRIEWCAVFVSWAANQAGVLNDKIPKFAGVATGIEWFKSRGQWQERGYSPRPGDIIFFDWEVDGKPNHVGIVEKTENGYIYTIEGNSTNDGCRAKKYAINSSVIFGFGLPAY